MRNHEERLGIVPIDDLLAERSTLIELVADLRARYGSFGTFEHIRKMELARLGGLVRAQAVRDKVKLTAAEVDDAEHDHPDYRDLITTATRERAAWCKLEAEIDALEHRIYRANVIARFATSEARMTV